MTLGPRWRITLISAGAAAVAVAFFLLWGLAWIFSPAPPAWQGPKAVLTDPLIVDADGTTRLGQAYRFRRSGIDACALTGTPMERGAAMGRLFDQDIQAVEISLMQTVQRFIPWEWARWLLSKFVLVRNYKLPRFIPAEVLAEMQGVALGSRDVYPRYGEHYARLLNYLAAHDLSHALMNDRALAGCTAFGATARATAGQVLLARNFDFEAGNAFDEHKLVMRIQPNAGHAFLSVAWPGMFGVVTGLNDAGIGVVLLAAHSSDKPGVGTPVSVVARQVLEQAQTLDQAIAVIRSAKVFVSESLLVGSAAENAFVVVEKTPTRCGVRGRAEDVVLATNHFLTPELKDDPNNQAYRQAGTSDARWRRLSELVRVGTGPLDVPRCVAILRDCRAPGGGSQGLGNRQAINALIASHSVVMDLKNKIIWVSAGPHQLGEFVPFALDTLDQAPVQPVIPADDCLVSGGYEKFQQYMAGLEQGERLLQKHQYQEALSYFMEVRSLNPEHYRSFFLAGIALQAMNRHDEARYNFAQALVWHPAFPLERREAEMKLKQLKEKAP
jgi:tetratricopeptide (TPR) repeat protein